MNYQKLIKKYEQEFIEDLAGLIEIQSLRDETTIKENQPFGKGCRDALDYMLNLAKKDGFKVDDVDGYAGVISLGEQDESLAMLGHLDVVPVDNQWDTDPFKLVIKDGVGFARGILDDKGPTIAAYYALKMIKESNLNLNKKIELIVGCDEESGMECMQYYKKHRKHPSMGFVPDADFPVIYGEKGIMNVTIKGQNKSIIQSLKAGSRPNVVIGEASIIVCKELEKDLFEKYLTSNHLTGFCSSSNGQSEYMIKGLSFHGSMPHKGLNAAIHCLKFIDLAYGDSLANSLTKLLENPFGQGLNINHDGSYMSALSMNLGIIDITDNQVSFLIDIRYPNDVSADSVIENIKASLKKCNSSLEIESFSNSDPLFVDPQSDLVKTCMSVYQEFSNDTFSPAKTMGGGTYARVFENMFAFGPEFPLRKKLRPMGGPHEKNEGFYMEDLYLASAIYAEVIKRLLAHEN